MFRVTQSRMPSNGCISTILPQKVAQKNLIYFLMKKIAEKNLLIEENRLKIIEENIPPKNITEQNLLQENRLKIGEKNLLVYLLPKKTSDAYFPMRALQKKMTRNRWTRVLASGKSCGGSWCLCWLTRYRNFQFRTWFLIIMF